jgi:hypothetical protein
VILFLKPKGPGNWRTTVMSIDGAHVQPMLVKVGTTFVFGGVVFRICRVEP